MYAIFESGGKQFRAVEGLKIFIDPLSYTENEPFVVKGTVCDEQGVRSADISLMPVKKVRGKKVCVFKKKRRTNYRRYAQHKRDYLCVEVKTIVSVG